MSNLVPELALYVTNAYNAKTGNFLNAPVFVVSYNDGATVYWGNSSDLRSIPDQITASAATSGITLQSTALMESTADYDRLYSATVDIAYTGVSFNGTASSAFLYHGNLFQSNSSVYGLNYSLEQVLTFSRLAVKPSGVTQAFYQTLAALPPSINADSEQSAYISFFNTYGTHYVSTGALGGTIIMESQINDSLFSTSNSDQIKAALGAGFGNMVSSGSMNASVAYSSSTFLQQHANTMSSSVSVMGGLFDSASTTVKQWYDSLYVSPTLMLTQYAPKSTPLSRLACLSQLVPMLGLNPAIADNIVTMLDAYVGPGLAQDGFLTNPRKMPANTVLRASAGDTIVFGFLKASSTDKSNNTVNAMQGAGSNPNTVYGMASVDYSTSSDTIVPAAAFCMPVPAGSYFDVTVPATTHVTTTLYAVGLGSTGTASLGQWSNVTLNAGQNAPADGFVVAMINWNNSNGARGYVQGKQAVVTSSGITINEVMTGASEHRYSSSGTYVHCNSFCMPVAKGQAYSVVYEKTSESPKASAAFIPLSTSGALAFQGPPQQRTEGQTYTAETDGFLMAYISYGGDDGGRGYVNLYSIPGQGDPASTNTDLVSLGLQGSASVHYYKHDDTYVPYNSVCIPVPKGNAYQAKLTKTSKSPTVLVTWMPLVPGSL